MLQGEVMRQRNPHRHLGLGVALWLAGAVAGCGGSSGGSVSMNPMPPRSPNSPGTSAPPAGVQAQQANTPVDPAIRTADNTFGLKLRQNLNSGAMGNVAIAPISVAVARQIGYTAADGVTLQGVA